MNSPDSTTEDVAEHCVPEEHCVPAERLQKYLARCGIASRRKCEEIIAGGTVTVNGVTVLEMGTKVTQADTVCVAGWRAVPETAKRYVLLNKPAGYVCSLSDEQGRPVAADLLAERYAERLYNVGRLDMYSSGLLLFTNDGDFAATVSHPSSQIEKEYLIETTVPIPRVLCEQFARGIRINDVFYRAITVHPLDARHLKTALIEGKNREIRRVFEYFSVPIRRLVRIRIGDITLGDLQEGASRDLTSAEVAALHRRSYRL